MYNPFMYQPQFSQGAMQGMQQRDKMQGRVDNLQARIGNLQEQYKAAGSDQQAGIQNRINTLQGRMGDLQGKMDAGGGANRMGMEYRRERRQAKNAGTYDPQAQGGQPEPAMWQGGMMPGMGGSRGYMLPDGSFSNTSMGGMGMGGMGFGGYGGWQSGGGMGGMGEMSYRMGGMPQGMFPQPQYRTQEAGQNQGGATPVAPYNPTAQPQAQGGGWNPAWGTPTDQFGNATSPAAYNQRMNSTNAELNAFNANNPSGRMPVLGQDVFKNMMGSGSFDTPFGNLVTASGGNSHLFKKNGMSEADGSYYYDPSQNQWNQISVEDYRRYGDQIDWNAMNPYGSEATARRAGATNASNYW